MQSPRSLPATARPVECSPLHPSLHPLHTQLGLPSSWQQPTHPSILKLPEVPENSCLIITPAPTMAPDQASPTSSLICPSTVFLARHTLPCWMAQLVYPIKFPHFGSESATRQYLPWGQDWALPLAQHCSEEAGVSKAHLSDKRACVR